MLTFILKKIIAQFFMPETFCLILILSGLIIIWFTRKQKTGKILITIGTLLLLLFSYKYTANILTYSLENQHQIYIQNKNIKVKYIVVLGGGVKYNKTQPISSQIGETTLVRLVEGIRLLRLNPGAKLILSGGKTFSIKSEAEIMSSIANILGVNNNSIILDPISLNTQMQAVNIKKIVKNYNFFLVTSAMHMPRSVLLFKHYGMNPLPAPTAYKSGNLSPSPFLFFPSPGALGQCASVIHEYLGLIWFKMSNL